MAGVIREALFMKLSMIETMKKNRKIGNTSVTWRFLKSKLSFW